MGNDDEANAYSLGVRDAYSQIGDRAESFARLRARGEVIREASGPMTTSHEAAACVFKDPLLFSSKFPPIGRAHRPLIPIQNDPPEHKMYRRLFDPLFSPKAVKLLIPKIRATVNGLIDDVIDNGSCVFDEAIGTPLPTHVFLTMMGLPLEDSALLHELKDGILRPGFREGIDPSETETINAIADDTVNRIYAYFQDLIDRRRGSVDDEDIFNAVLTAEFDGRQVTDEEVLDACFLLLIAGLDTITNSLGLFYFQLATRPDLRQHLVRDPSVIPRAVEELLRWETPTPAVFRVATRDTEICGHAIKAGEIVTIDLGSANTDPSQDPGASELNFDRPPLRHFTFSGGIHRCSGSHLARQELQIVLEEWHRRIPDYWIQEGTEPVWPPGLRSVEHLVLEWRR